MGVSVTRNFGPLTDLRLLGRDDWDRVGRLARERLVLRTRQGRDREDNLFSPYTPAYAEQKAKALGTGHRVDLTVSGDMLNAISVEADEQGVTLAFNR